MLNKNFKIKAECLRDIGCSEEELKEFAEYDANNNIAGIQKILQGRRREVVENIHKNQNVLCCIDYMLNEIKDVE